MNSSLTTPAQLTIYFDSRCALCSQARQWLEKEPMHLPVSLEDLHATSSQQQFTSCSLDPEKQLLVGDGEGNWWHGADAWLMALWATERFNAWSHSLAQERWRPLLRHFVSNFSSHRQEISKLLGMNPSQQSLRKLERLNQKNTPSSPATEPSAYQSSVPTAYLGHQKNPPLQTTLPSKKPRKAPQSNTHRASPDRE